MMRCSRSLTSVWRYILLLLFATIFPAHAEENPTTTPLELIKVQKKTFHGQPALAAIFSTPLKREQTFNQRIITTLKKDGSAVEGDWIFAQQGQILYFTHIQPATTYHLQFTTDIEAENGEKLAQKKEITLKTDAAKAQYGFAGQGTIIPAHSHPGLPVITVNVPRVNIQFLRVKDNALPAFLRKYYWQRNRQLWDTQLDERHTLTKSVFQGQFETKGKQNSRTTTYIPIHDIDALKKPGLYVAVMSQPNRFGKFHIAYFTVSNMALHLRAYEKKMGIYAISFKDGQPMADVNIQLFNAKNETIARVTTDDKGYAELQSTPHRDRVIIARKGEHLTLLSFRHPALDLSEFNIKGPPQRDHEIYIYTPRDLYRPGEQSHFSMILRDHDGQSIQNQPIIAQLKRPDGRIWVKRTLQAKKSGYYQWSFKLPSDAPTGLWNLEARLNPQSKHPHNVYAFHVEEFLPERMKLQLHSKKKILHKKEKATINVQGDYLYGAPASGNRLKLEHFLKPAFHPVEQWPKFFFGDENKKSFYQRKDLPEQKLNIKGSVNLTLPDLLKKTAFPLRIGITARLLESGGRPVSRTIYHTYWPHQSLIGVRPLFNQDDAPDDQPAPVEIIHVDDQGNLLAASQLEIKIIREEREYFWNFQANHGWRSHFTEIHYPVFHQKLSIKKGEKGLIKPTLKFGRYRLEIFDPQSQLTTRFRFQSGGWGEMRHPSRPDRMQITWDKKSYTPGDHAKLTFTPPYDGEALIILESQEGQIHHEWRSVEAKQQQFKFEIPKNWHRHDIYASVMILKKDQKEKTQRFTPNRAMGLIHLPLKRPDHTLDISLVTKDKIRPEGPLSVEIHLKDPPKKAPTFVTLAAVDLGVLNITDFKTPDARNHFFAKRRYGVESRDVYGQVVENINGVKGKLRFGGDAAGLRRNKRGKDTVRILSLFQAPVQFDQQGIAKVTLDIPEFDGTMRLMALAFSENRFGSSEKEVLSVSPIVIQPAMPRFLALGDRGFLGLDLDNRSGKEQILTMQLTATSPLKMEPVNRHIPLPPNKKRFIRFPIHTTQTFGTGAIQLHLHNSELDIKRDWQIPIRPAYPGQFKTRWFTLKPKENFSLTKKHFKGLIPNSAEMRVHIASTPPLPGKKMLKGLFQYPYGCLEQTLSRAYPWLYLDKKASKSYQIDEATFQKRQKAVEDALIRIGGMQKVNGAFGLWNHESPTEPWLTPFAADFLLEARKQGFPIPEERLKKVLTYLKQWLKAGGRLPYSFHTRDKNHSQFASKVYAGYVLAKAGQAQLSLLRPLYKQRKQAISPLPLVHLGRALLLQGDRKRGKKILKEAIKKTRPDQGYLADYGSTVRDMAMVIALHGQKPFLNNVGQYSRQLLTHLKKRTHLSTQEKLALFLADLHLRKQTHTAWQVKIQDGKKEQTEKHKKPWSTTLTPINMSKRWRLQNLSKIPLYLRLETTGYTQKPPAVKKEPFIISRTLYTMSGKLLKQQHLNVGENVLVRLRVYSRITTPHGLVVDLLPAGFEIENPHLQQGEVLSDISVDKKPIRHWQRHTRIQHQEYRDDRYVAAITIKKDRTAELFYRARVVSPGRYIIPPPFFEDMYHPEQFAIGLTPEKLHVVDTPPKTGIQ
ncbi:alpha-2-macroglobulin family protein [Magnetococcales bacterium HHB-1]